MRTAACVVVKNEAEFLREWIAYQRVIGFSTVILYDNASSDATRDIALSMASILDVRIHDWPESTDQRSQMKCYETCLNDYADEFDWIALIDADEFMVSSDGARIYSLLSRNKHASAIALNWLCFGSNGHDEAPVSLTTTAFTRRSEPNFGPNSHTKMIVRPRDAKCVVNAHYVDVHGPIVSPTGSPMTWQQPGVALGMDVGWWQLNHYFTRSREHWRRKVAKGYRGYGALTTRKIDDFEIYDRNEILDSKAARYSGEVLDIIRISLGGENWRSVEGVGPEPTAPVTIVRAVHSLWTSELLLGSNNRLKHSDHSSLGEYLLADDFLLVKWDNWPAELFRRRDNIFASIEITNI